MVYRGNDEAWSMICASYKEFVANSMGLNRGTLKPKSNCFTQTTEQTLDQTLINLSIFHVHVALPLIRVHPVQGSKIFELLLTAFSAVMSV